LGENAFRMLMADTRFDGIPLVLETPDETLWPDEINKLKSWIPAQ
jgi:deoxyribonuclease-4